MLTKFRYTFSLFVLLILGWGQHLQGQTLAFNLSSDSGFHGDTVAILIAVDSFTVMSGYQGTFRWDSTVLDFLELNSPTTGITNIFGNPGQGLIPLDAATFTWVDFSGIGKSLPDGSVVIEIRFVIKANASIGISPVVMDSSVTLLGYSSNAAPLSAPIVNQGSITVIAPQAPHAVCQNLTLYLDSLGLATISPADLLDGGSSVTFGPAQFSVSKDSFGCLEMGANQVSLYVSDANGLIDSCMALVTIVDTIAPIVICQNLSITLDSTGIAVIDAFMIDGGSTDACGIQSMTLSQDTFGVADIGQQAVTLTMEDNSGNTSSCVANVTVENTTGIEDALSEAMTSLQLYPNPADGVINLQWDSPWYGSVSIGILNQLGQEVHQEIKTKNTPLFQTSMMIQNLPTGIYIVQIKQDSHIRYARMVKQ